jgi:acetyl-CoA synthetase
MTATRAWEPTAAYWDGSRLQAVMTALGVEKYQAFYELSVECPELFWDATLADLGCQWFCEPRHFAELGQQPARPQWFPGGVTNAAHNALFRWLPDRPADTALISVDEFGSVVTRTIAELAADVLRTAAGLQVRGICRGDRVALLLPYDYRAATALLAAATIGAIAVPIFTGFAAPAIAQRLAHSGAQILVTCDGFTRAGRFVDLGRVAATAVAEHPILLADYAELASAGAPMDATRATDLAAAAGVAVVGVDSSEPLLIGYTSGTTGTPKGAVHTHVGLPIKACQELTQLMDLRRGSVLLRLTDLGWVGGSYTIVSGLMAGATILLYSGSPSIGRPNRVLELAATWRVTHLAISPSWARTLRRADENPAARLDLDALRFTSSVGEPWDAPTYDWYFNAIGGGRLPIINHSGSTEVGNLLACVPVLPIVGGTFNTAVPGIALDVVDGSGRPVVGHSGDLVVRQPFLGMTSGLWQDPERYEQTYWQRHPGLWDQGDLATRQVDGRWRLDGRSDDRIKISGRGIMPEEVEAVVRRIPGVAAAAAVAVPDADGGSVLAVLIERSGPDDAGTVVVDGTTLTERVRNLVRAEIGSAFVPRLVRIVERLPRTANGKIMRRALTVALSGHDYDTAVLSDEDAAALRAIATPLDHIGASATGGT